jgi:hypothetical protein
MEKTSQPTDDREAMENQLGSVPNQKSHRCGSDKVVMDASSVSWPFQLLNPMFRLLTLIDARYTQEQILSVQIAHKNAANMPDKLALATVRLLRWGMDFVTGYRSPSNTKSAANTMTEKQWITRFIFLESVAGVPGMVAGMLRHLKSIRRMKRDYGW